MPLQIRRGPTADRLSTVPLEGELIYDSTTGAVFIGNGFSFGGVPVTNISAEDVRNIAASQFLGISFNDNSLHTGITFQNVDNRIIATVNDSLSGNFSGNFFAEDSGLVIDGRTGTVYGPFIGSLFSEDSTLLVNGDNGSINLDGTVKGDITPDSSEEYDIGSPSNRFKDLYLSGSSLWLGDAQLTASGESLVLPSGTTVDGNPVGIELGQEYEINVKGDLRGSVYPDDSTVPTNPEDPEDSTRTQPLVDAINGSINLNRTVKGNIVPDVTETHNIGSITNRFNKLYLTESNASLWIGNAVIGATSTVIDLPVGSTVGGIPIGSGSGTGDGVVEGSNYKINVVGNDSTLLVDSDNNRFFGILVGNVLGDVTGNLTGNVIGSLDGDVSGSVFADDSSILVDGIDKRFFGNLLGDVTGNLTGNVVTSRIQSPDSSQIIIEHNTRFSSQLVVDDDAVVEGTLTVRESINVDSNAVVEGVLTVKESIAVLSSNPEGRMISVEQYHNEPISASIAFKKARGTLESQLAVQNDDRLGDIDWNAWTGTGNYTSATIRAAVEGTVTGASVPSRIEFLTTGSSGELRRAAFINSDSELVTEFTNRQVLNVGGSAPSYFLSQSFNETNARPFLFSRSRGVAAVPTTLIENDIMGNIAFQGYSQFALSNITGTISSTSTTTTIVLSAPSTTAGMIPGQLLTKVSGDGAFGGTTSIVSIDSVNTITITSETLNTAGSITFNVAGYNVAAQIRAISFPGPNGVSGGIQFQTFNGVNLANRVVINTAGRINAFFGLGLSGTITPITVGGDIEFNLPGLDGTGTGTINLRVPTQTTVGAAGPANALPASPSTYLKIKVGEVEYLIPAFAMPT